MYMYANIGNRYWQQDSNRLFRVRTYIRIYVMYVKIVPLREEKFWGEQIFRLTNINNWFSVF